MKLIYKPEKYISSQYTKIKSKKIYTRITNFGVLNENNKFRRIYVDICKNKYFIKNNKKREYLDIKVINNDFLLYKRYDELMKILNLY